MIGDFDASSGKRHPCINICKYIRLWKSMSKKVKKSCKMLLLFFEKQFKLRLVGQINNKNHDKQKKQNEGQST